MIDKKKLQSFDWSFGGERGSMLEHLEGILKIVQELPIKNSEIP